MNVWKQLDDWLATLIVAAMTWVSGAIGPALPPGAETAMPGETGPTFILAWAQEADQPPIEQVGEGTGDVETLDESAAPPADVQPTDQEDLDAGAAPAAQEDDVELLDQGTPPVAVNATAPPAETVYAAPVADTSTTYVAPEPAAAAGPVLPADFGTGRVHASAGRAGFPPGLDNCHVGAVTGRAYAGIDCGEDEESAFVGHAPSFEEFPFVVDAEFPFEGDEAFFSDDFPFGDDAEVAVAGNQEDEDGNNVFASAGRRARNGSEDEETAPVIETSGSGSVEFAQRARDREPRVRVENGGSNRNKESNKRERDNGSAAENNDRGANAESADKDTRKNKGKNNDKDNDKHKGDRADGEDKEQGAKDKKGKKQGADRKDDRNRSRKDP